MRESPARTPARRRSRRTRPDGRRERPSIGRRRRGSKTLSWSVLQGNCCARLCSGALDCSRSTTVPPARGATIAAPSAPVRSRSACYTAARRGTRVQLYSHSRLSAYEKCRKQYRFRYIEKRRRDTQSIEAFMGNRVHEALEALYRDRQRSKIPSRQDLLALYHRRWKAEYNDKITIVKTDLTADHYRKVGEACIVKYYDRYHPFDDGETIGLEEAITLSLDDHGHYQIQGYIDRLVRREPGVYEIQDFKTSGGWLPTEAELRKDRQLALYQMAVEKRYPDARDIRLVWHYLVADRRLTSRRTAEELARHRSQAIELIDSIEKTQEFPARPGVLCRWCDYLEICEEGRKHLGIETAPPQPVRWLDKAEQIPLFG